MIILAMWVLIIFVGTPHRLLVETSIGHHRRVASNMHSYSLNDLQFDFSQITSIEKKNKKTHAYSYTFTFIPMRFIVARTTAMDKALV